MLFFWLIRTCELKNTPRKQRLCYVLRITKNVFEPDVIRTRNLLIWSQTRYRCATSSLRPLLVERYKYFQNCNNATSLMLLICMQLLQLLKSARVDLLFSIMLLAVKCSFLLATLFFTTETIILYYIKRAICRSA